MSNNFKLYAHKLPNEKMYINFEFIERQEHSLICRLIDYDIVCSMPLQYLTRKKKIKSLNKMTPLNKPMIGSIEKVNDDDITISIAYIEHDSESYLKFKEESINNNFLKNQFVRYSKKNKINSQELWNKYIHSLDIQRVEESELSLYEYFIENFQDMKIELPLKEFISEQLLSKEKEKLDKTSFKMVSTDGVLAIKKLLGNTLEEMKLNCDIHMDGCPDFIISSRDKVTKKDQHTTFLVKIKKKIDSEQLNIYLTY